MALFYFDRSDNGILWRDNVGVELETAYQAGSEAADALENIAKGTFRDTAHRVIAIDVSDAERTPLFRLALTFELQSSPEVPADPKWAPPHCSLR